MRTASHQCPGKTAAAARPRARPCPVAKLVLFTATCCRNMACRSLTYKGVLTLLCFACRLELPALTAALHTFIRINSCTPSLTAPDSPLLDTATLAAVFSRRVVAEHAHAGDACRAALINNIMLEPCALAAGPGLRQLLKPLDVLVMHNKPGLDIVYAGPPAAPSVIKFTAEVLQGFRGFRQGQKVSVELDLFGKSRVLIGAEGAGSSMAAHSVQLLLGLRG